MRERLLMRDASMFGRVAIVVAGLLLADVVACSINPQPLPPGDADEGQAGAAPDPNGTGFGDDSGTKAPGNGDQSAGPSDAAPQPPGDPSDSGPPDVGDDGGAGDAGDAGASDGGDASDAGASDAGDPDAPDAN